TWITRTGTAENDDVQWAGINADAGYVLLAGETDGVFDGQSASGGTDSFLQRIDTEPDGNNQVPALAWTRQAGSGFDDTVAGGSAESVTPLLFGSVAGSVEGEPVIGGIDAFFYSASSADSDLRVSQIGTEGDEPVADGLFSAGTLWLIGRSNGLYSIQEQEEADPVLARAASDSYAGFLLGYSVTGTPNRAFSLNDQTDQANVWFWGLTGFDEDMVVAGATDGDFAGGGVVSGSTQGIVSRISLVAGSDTGEAVFENNWRYQLNQDDSEILALENFRDDEIVALSRVGSDWFVLLFSPEGELLTPLN
ncbi:MAG: hypothetical protein H5U30_12330, partial [Marinobacter sp.]|nr:hypothetical protein [Marinobacter sp.]